MYEREHADAFASDEMGEVSLKDKVTTFAKIGFLIVTAILAIHIFMKAIYFAHL